MAGQRLTLPARTQKAFPGSCKHYGSRCMNFVLVPSLVFANAVLHQYPRRRDERVTHPTRSANARVDGEVDTGEAPGKTRAWSGSSPRPMRGCTVRETW